LRCIVNYGPGEEQLVATFHESSSTADPLIYNGGLGPLMALLQNALCIVGGDTGPLHLAVALGTPAVALFGPTDPARNGPYRVSDSGAVAHSDIVLRSPRAVTTYKRGDQPDLSMLELEVDAVFDAVRRQVEARA
jgi:lipopolysaccharide heptosyltransferase I